LICRFCSQWNPEGGLRCCFCSNPFDATEDNTRAGVPDYVRNTGQQYQIPKAIRSEFAQRPPGEIFNPLEAIQSGGVERVKGILFVVAIVIGVIVALWIKCS